MVAYQNVTPVHLHVCLGSYRENVNGRIRNACNVHRMHDILKDLLVHLVYNNIVWRGVTLCCKFTVPVNISYTVKFKVLSLWENVSSASKAPSNPFVSMLEIQNCSHSPIWYVENARYCR